jgi:hypothetical protein
MPQSNNNNREKFFIVDENIAIIVAGGLSLRRFSWHGHCVYEIDEPLEFTS